MEEDARVTKEAAEKAQEEATRSKEETALAEEATAKAREEVERYKGDAIELDKGKRQVESDLAAARGNYAWLKEELLMSEIAWGAAELAEKKAHEDLETEEAPSHSLFNDVDRLKKLLREKEDAILQSGKLIEDLQVEKTELARSYKRIERANTDFIGENTTLMEKTHGEFSTSLCLLCFCGVCFQLTDPLFWSPQGLRMSCWRPRPTPSPLRHSSRGGCVDWSAEDRNKRPLNLLGTRAYNRGGGGGSR